MRTLLSPAPLSRGNVINHPYFSAPHPVFFRSASLASSSSKPRVFSNQWRNYHRAKHDSANLTPTACLVPTYRSHSTVCRADTFVPRADFSASLSFRRAKCWRYSLYIFFFFYCRYFYYYWF